MQVITGTPAIDERGEAGTESNWYQAEPGTWLPRSMLDGAPLERMRLPDSQKRLRTRIYYDAVFEVCQRPYDGPVVVQMLTNMRAHIVPWLRQLKQCGVAVLCSVTQFPAWTQKPVKRLFRRRTYQRIFNEFDAVVVNSEAIEEVLREIGVTTRIEYIPNGVNLERFHPCRSNEERQSAEALRDRFGIPAGDAVIAIVGAVMPRKGSDEIIKAWRLVLTEYPATHLLFVGPRADTHNPRLKSFRLEIANLIETSGAGDRIHFAGVVDDVESYLRASDIFILASDREGTPNSVLEAMASGLPCLITPYSGISPSIGQAGQQYQLVERNPKAISTALLALLKNPDLRGTQGARGQQFVVENFDQNLTLDRYVALYEELGLVSADRKAAT